MNMRISCRPKGKGRPEGESTLWEARGKRNGMRYWGARRGANDWKRGLGLFQNRRPSHDQDFFSGWGASAWSPWRLLFCRYVPSNPTHSHLAVWGDSYFWAPIVLFLCPSQVSWLASQLRISSRATARVPFCGMFPTSASPMTTAT